MKYVLVAGDDLQREFHLARSQPRHLAATAKAPIISLARVWKVLSILRSSLNTPSRMFRRSLRTASRHRLDRLSNRLTKILSEIRKLNHPITGRDWPDKRVFGSLTRTAQCSQTARQPSAQRNARCYSVKRDSLYA